jgi:hypothetical protein
MNFSFQSAAAGLALLAAIGGGIVHADESRVTPQARWLAEGWRPLGGPAEAQDASNKGLLVVASYHNHRDDKPGHIAIVRPGDASVEKINSEGPDVIQAATINSASISVKAGFAGHVSAWNDNEIDYYAHAVRMLEPTAR